MKFQLIIITILLGTVFYTANAQIAIGKDNVTNSSVLLEFGTASKGIIVPQVTSSTGAVAGTFVFDANDRMVKVREARNNGTNSNWTNLTQNSVQGVLHNFTNSGTENAQTNGVVIGSETSTKPGALVLESTTKALVLPKVANPHSTMSGSIAGTIVYDTASGTLAVYDGVNWSYWK